MMAPAIKLVFVAGHSIVKSNLAGQAAFCQQLQCAVDGGKSDFWVFLPGQAKKLVSRKMVAGLQESAEDGIALVRMLQAHTSQVLVKNLLGFTHGFACGRRMVVNSSL